MDVSWYDNPEITAGKLSQQLATDCMMVKALTGDCRGGYVGRCILMHYMGLLVYVY